MKKQSQNLNESFDIIDAKANYDSIKRYRWETDMRFPVFPTSLREVVRSDSVYLRHVNYPFIAMEFQIRGETLYTDNENRYLSSPGDIFIIVPHSNVKISNANPGKQLHKLNMIVKGNAPSMICDMLGFNHDTLLKLKNPQAIEKRMRRIGRLIAKQADHQLVATLFYDFMLTLSLEHRKNSQLLPPEMENLKNFICANLSYDLTSETLANVTGVSQSTLRRQVRKHFACSPGELCTLLRLEHAVMLLRTTGRAVKDIATACGFSTPLYFGMVFKKYYGITPGKYRNSDPVETPMLKER